MTVSSITPFVVPTGGAVTLQIVASGSTMQLARAVSGASGIGAYTTFYSGAPMSVYVDAGDGQPTPLASGSTYVYRLSDANGTTTTPGVMPATSLDPLVEPLLPLLVRLIQAGVNNLVIPKGIGQATVQQAMPLTGMYAMPFVVVNMDLMQQQAVPIGQSAGVYDSTGAYTINGFVRRVFRISVLAANAVDRDYYRDALIAIIQGLYYSVFQPIGLDNTHSFQVVAGQYANDPDGHTPGFYYADLLYDFQGTLNNVVTYGGGIINVIQATATAVDGVQTIVRVPIGS